jgi:hypothetical protein
MTIAVLALWRPGSRDLPLELVGLRLDYCRTDLARGVDAEWIATRLADACAPLGSAIERTAEQRFRINPGSAQDRVWLLSPRR